MPDATPFADLIRRVRAGDDRAAEEVVRRYESTIRVAVRTRLTDPALKRLLDSVDICQSVLASFFVRAAVGQYDLDEPGQLVALPRMNLKALSTAEVDARWTAVTADFFSLDRNDRAMEELVARICIEPQIKSARWERTTP